MTLVKGADLGTTDDPTELIKGDAGQISTDASTLSTAAAAVKGLRDTVSKLTIDSWTGGVGAPAYELSWSEQVAHWETYHALLDNASKALSTYSTAVSTAQSSAQDAIDQWNKGQAATATATTAYNNSVDTYNKQVATYDKQWNAAASGKGSWPTTVPTAPGVFVDPGEKLRQQARTTLKNARQTLQAAADTCTQALGGLPGSKTDGSAGFFNHEGKFEWPKLTFNGKDWSFGKDKWLDDNIGDKDHKPQPWEISLGKLSGSANVWGAKGSVDDYWGPMKVHADGSVDVLGVDGSVEAKINSDGLVVEVGGKAVLVDAQGNFTASHDIGGVHLGVEGQGEAMVGADADGSITFGKDGGHVGGEAFAGGRIDGSVHGDIGGIKPGVTGELSYGVGAALDADAGMHHGTFEVKGTLGATLGLGGKVGFDLEIDPKEVLHSAKGLAEDVEGWFE